MKLLITSALAATLATAAFAGNSDRYNDNRFDSAVGHVDAFAEAPRASERPVKPRTAATYSTNDGGTSSKGKGYAYENPYGVGPDNDSR